MSSDKFKKVFDNRLAEINYDATLEIQAINDFFSAEIDNGYYKNVTGGQTTYHVDYGNISEMKHWIALTDIFEQLMKNMGSSLDFNEFKHTLKYTFIRMPPHGVLPPHTASFIRAMSSVNVPLRGKTIIDLYEDSMEDPHVAGEYLDNHHYTSPILLNVHEFHGVVNNSDKERMILKVHVPVIRWKDVLDSFSKEVKVFDFDVPWSNTRGTRQRI
jgi:hypothetical protein